MQVATHAKTGQNHDLTRKLAKLFFDNAQSIYLLDCLILRSHVSDWLQHVPVATYTKKGIAFYQLHQENF